MATSCGSADELYDDLDEVGQAAARQVILRLTTLGEGTEDTRRRVRQAELRSLSIGSRALEEVLETFDRSRLLTFDCDPVTREPTVEIAHEALLRSWGRLREWLDTNRDDLRVQRRLQAAAVEWSGARRDSSFLASGTRLAQFEALAAEVRVVLNHEEIEYVQASTADRERQLATDREQQSRELSLARQAFSAQRSAAHRLRYLVAVLITFLVVAIGLSLFAFDRQASAQANADESQSLALASAAQVALSKGNTDLALALAVAANGSTRPPALAQRMLFEAAYGPGVKRIFTGHTDAVRGLAMSPDGQLALSASQDKTLILWDVGTGQLIRRLVGHDRNVWSVAFSPDGKTALSGSADKSLILWDVDTGQIIRRFTGHSDEVRAVAISPDGKTALSASYDKLLILWDLSTGQELRRFSGHTDRVWAVAYSPDGRTMLSGSGNVEGAVDNSMRRWDLSTGQEIRRFGGHTDTVRTVAFSPDGTMALSGSFDKTLILWNLQTGQEIRRFTGHKDRVLSVAFSPDGRTALSSSADTSLILWDVQMGKAIHQYKGHTDAVPGVVLSPDGRTALSASHDRTLRLWDFQETAERYRIGAEVTNTQVSAAISPDGRLMAVRLRPTDVALYDARTGQLSRRFEDLDPQDPARLLAFNPDGQSVLIGFQSGLLSLREVSSGREVRRFKADDFGPKQDEGQFYVSNLAFSPDGRTIALGLLRTVRLFEVATGREIRRFEGITDWVNCVAFSPDGHSLAAGFGTGMSFDSGSRVDTSVRLWDVSTGQEIRRLTSHTNAVTGVAFSPDGQSIFSSSFSTADGPVRCRPILGGIQNDYYRDAA